MTTARSLVVNAGSNLSVMVVKLGLAFVMTPVLVRNLGRYDFGVWEMLGAVLGYMGLLDVGLRPALSRFAAHYRARGDREGLEVTFATGVMFMGAVGACLLAVLAGCGLFFPATFAQAKDSNTWRYTALLIIVGTELGVTFPGAVAESYLEGFQKYYVKNNITIINSIVGNAIVYLLITPHNGLVLLALGNALGVATKYGLFYQMLSRPEYGAVRFRRARFSGRALKEMLVFGAKAFVQGIATRVEYATDSLVIGTFLGPAMVPLYSIPANLVGYVRTFGANITHAFMPLFSELNARHEHDRAIRTYLTASRIAVGAIVPIGLGMILVGGPFIRVWIGKDFGGSADTIIALLVVFTVLPALNPLASRYLTAINRHGIYATLTPFSACVNLGCSIALVKPLGIVGVAVGSVVAAVIFVPIYLHRCCRHLGIRVALYLRRAVAPCALPAVLMTIVVITIRVYWGLNSYPMVLLGSVTGATVYTTAFWTFSLNAEERELVAEGVLHRLQPSRRSNRGPEECRGRTPVEVEVAAPAASHHGE